MKGLCASFAVLAVLACGTFADAAQPSAAKLSQMGLSSATVVSDSVAVQVRGEGFAFAASGGYANALYGSASVKTKNKASSSYYSKKASSKTKASAYGVKPKAKASGFAIAK